jgi:hypothetical protein
MQAKDTSVFCDSDDTGGGPDMNDGSSAKVVRSIHSMPNILLRTPPSAVWDASVVDCSKASAAPQRLPTNVHSTAWAHLSCVSAAPVCTRIPDAETPRYPRPRVHTCIHKARLHSLSDFITNMLVQRLQSLAHLGDTLYCGCMREIGHDAGSCRRHSVRTSIQVQEHL